MKKKFVVVAIAATMMIGVGTGLAETYKYEDTWIDFPGYTSPISTIDEYGTPNIDALVIQTDDHNNLLSIDIVMRTEYIQEFDTLFLSTGGAWDSWDYIVHDGGDMNSHETKGNIPKDGLWSVDGNYEYTFVGENNRVGNPNGIDRDYLSIIDSTLGRDHVHYGTNAYALHYDFTGQNIAIDPNNFFVAYTPWCGNDIIGGGTAGAPVPEPATMLLLGTGIMGIAGWQRKRMKK